MNGTTEMVGNDERARLLAVGVTVPEQPPYAFRNYLVICRFLLLGTYLAIGAQSAMLAVGWVWRHDLQAPGLLVVCGLATAYVGGTHWLLRRGRYRTVAYLLICFYTFMPAWVVWIRGINAPIGLLFFGMVIVLAGALLAARQALVAGLISSAILIGMQVSMALGWHEPYGCPQCAPRSSFSDVLAYCTILCLLALVTWLYGREVERSAERARQAEAALLRQKATLKSQVAERTAQLRQAQLDEMQQMYRFSELGQLGVTLLHELANHLTALTLEIEGLRSKQHSKAIARAREITRYLEDIVDSTRTRLQGGTQEQTFSVTQKTHEVVELLRRKAVQAGVAIDWRPPKQPWRYTGDPASLSQVVCIVLSNAIDAAGANAVTAAASNARRVEVSLVPSATDITILVRDWGKGIPWRQRQQLFKPSHSAKKSGLGLGLYIAKQTVEMQFGGALTLSPATDRTEFVIRLSLAAARKRTE